MASELLGFSFWVLVGSECKPQTALFYRSWEVPEGAGQTRVVAKMGFKKGNGQPRVMWRPRLWASGCLHPVNSSLLIITSPTAVSLLPGSGGHVHLICLCNTRSQEMCVV